MRKNLSRIIFAALAIWVVALLFVTRYYMLDDALIHLNYARYLHDRHFITYDGITPSFGTSSLVYVVLLACLRSFTESALLSKIVSVVAFAGFLVSLWRAFSRMAAESMGRFLIAGTAIVSCSAMGLRWLTDGMETGLSLWAVWLLCVLVWSEMRLPFTRPLRALGLVLFGAFLTLLRIELALLLMLSCLAILLARRAAAAKGNSIIAQFAGASYLGIGAVAAELLIYAYFKSFLPDTALAKSGHHASLDPFLGIVHVLASSLVLGIGTFLVWLLSATASYFHIKNHPSPICSLPVWITLSCSFPLLIVLACLRNQAVQGVRYVLWAMVFSIFLNAFQLADVPRAQFGWLGKSAVAGAFVLLLVWPVDAYLCLPSMITRGHNFVTMRDARLDGFAGKEIVAGDVGFVGYFTQGRICDMAGLVNGRTMAALSGAQRMHICVGNHVSAIFMGRPQLQFFNQFLPIGDWKVCKTVDFPTVSSEDWHYLATPDASLCPEMKESSQTLRQVFPELFR